MNSQDPNAGSDWLDVVMEEVRRKREEAAESAEPAPPDAGPRDTGGDRPAPRGGDDATD